LAEERIEREREIGLRLEAIVAQQFAGKDIWDTRKALRLSRRQLAEMLLVSETTIWRWEHDETCPNALDAAALEAFMRAAKKHLGGSR
jgi:DNA-binding transcriptional regulator YiaG